MALRNHALAQLGLFVALGIAHTWPLATDLPHWSRFDNPDAQLNAWIVTWVARATFRQPLQLFQGNIFYPEPDTIAYSEHLFVQSMLVAPFVWMGASPLLASNLVLLSGLVLTGWTTSLVLGSWTGRPLAGVLGGCLVAFNTHTFTRTAQIQAFHVEFLFPALWALDCLLTRARVRDGLLLAGAVVMQSLCSGYLLVATALSVVAGVVVRAADWLTPSRDRVKKVVLLGSAAVIAGLALLPFLLPYARVRAAVGLVRSLDEVARYSATPVDYFATVAQLHYRTWSRRFYTPGMDTLFPGVVALTLMATAIVTRTAFRDARARMLLALGLSGFALSFGPALPGYAFLYEVVPLLQGIRGAARFGFLALVGVGGLAAFGAAWVLNRSERAAAPETMERQDFSPGVTDRRRPIIIGTALVALANIEACTAPFDYTRFEGIPAIYGAIAREPQAVVAEFPFASSNAAATSGSYVLAAAAHLKPLVNGYSGFLPPSHARNVAAFERFPDERSFARLRELGVTHVVVHFDRMEDAERVRRQLDERWAIVASSRDATVYRLPL